MPMKLSARALSLTLSIALAGCAAETETSTEPVDPDALAGLPAARDEDRQTSEKSPAGEVKPAFTSTEHGSMGPTRPDPGDPGCSSWGCGANHNRRLVRL
jgi:hypothetical protein